ncbi:MAG: LysM peptidoglycan-binding domain-containing protein [Mobilitalea sp.]
MKRVKSILAIALCILLIQPVTTASAYTVKSNDTLTKISNRFKISTSTIKLHNNLKTTTLKPSQKLYIPVHKHKVLAGETLYKIATKYGVTLSALRTANNKWNDSVTTGQKLVIPGVKPMKGYDHVIKYTSAEVDLLARLIEAEAGGENYQAKLGVGGVVINRVQSSNWPNSISEVIYQKFGEYYQFTPVKNGMIKKSASQDSINAAWATIFGSDPSKGAIYYYDDSATNSWILAKPTTAKIDSMVFAK